MADALKQQAAHHMRAWQSFRGGYMSNFPCIITPTACLEVARAGSLLGGLLSCARVRPCCRILVLRSWLRSLKTMLDGDARATSQMKTLTMGARLGNFIDQGPFLSSACHNIRNDVKRRDTISRLNMDGDATRIIDEMSNSSSSPSSNSPSCEEFSASSSTLLDQDACCKSKCVLFQLEPQC